MSAHESDHFVARTRAAVPAKRAAVRVMLAGRQAAVRREAQGAFLPVLAYNGAVMIQIDAGGILDIAMSGTSATLLARKWESALLVNVDNDTLRRVLDNPEAMAAVERIEGWRALGDNIIETIITRAPKPIQSRCLAKRVPTRPPTPLSKDEV
jgi:hypothetical protein